jgi:hypothetical protein
MSDQLIKRSKLSFYAFGDLISEKDFIANNFSIFYDDRTACFSFRLLKELDYSFFEKNCNQYDTFVFEELYIINKISSFLKVNTQFQFFKLRIETDTLIELKLTNIKVQSSAIIFQSF